ncbi:hypothetical protein WJX74_001999 [Apatococcus lobatus]|uniref:Uncharacterized protein n=1 Tax=Apatococcus lobatus TaxID=904363 RepID=A0AAW1QDN0_9CHLO
MVACNYCESRAVSARSNASTEVRDVSIFHAILPLAESGYDPRGGGATFGLWTFVWQHGEAEVTTLWS